LYKFEAKESKPTLMKLLSKLFLTGTAIVGLSIGQASAQSDASNILRAGVADANILMNAYFQPFGEAFGVALNNNWYNTGKPLKLARFYLTIVPTLVQVPDEKLSYNVSDLGLSGSLRQLNPAVASGATLFGSDSDAQPTFGVFARNPITNADEKISEFTAPQGLGINLIPLPMLQLSVGLIKGTDVTIRYLPQLDIPGGGVDGKVGLFGIGVKHDLKQWIPGFGLLPFDLTGYFNYSTFNFSLGFNMPVPTGAGPTGLGYRYEGFTGPNDPSLAKQELAIRARGMGFGLIISRKLPVITPYASVGFANSSFSMKAAGDYAIESGVYANTTNPLDPDNGKVTVTKFTDPIDIASEAKNNLRAGVGLRVKLLILTIHGEYFIQGAFRGINAGVGIGIGN
jgi:hypothetical protein